MLVCFAMAFVLFAANCRANSLASQAYMQALTLVVLIGKKRIRYIKKKRWLLVVDMADWKKVVRSNVVNRFQDVI